MRVEPFSLPVASPLSTADGPIDRRDGFVVRVGHRGRTGLGESTPLAGWTESVSACESALERARTAGRRTGSDDRDRRRALRELDARDATAARHGLATAYLDADARAEGLPLYRWFDESHRCETVPVNATVGDGGPSETVAAARDAVDRGFDCLKLKAGARPVDADVERVRAVREAVGDDVALRLDANGAWDRQGASEAFERLDPLDVSYVEQPLPPADLKGLSGLRGGAVDVAVDETLAERSIAAVLEADAADVAILKPMVLGGPGTAHTLAARLREERIEPIVTTTVDAVVARTAAVHVAAAIPAVRACGLATADLLADDLGPDPAPVADGAVSVPQDSGLGIDPADVSTTEVSP